MKNKKNRFFKKSLSRKTILITVSMVVQKKYVKKRTVKIGESYSSFERPLYIKQRQRSHQLVYTKKT